MNVLKRITVILLLFLAILTFAGYLFRKKIISHFTPSVEQVGEITLCLKNDTCYLASVLAVTNRSRLNIQIDTLKYSVSFLGKTYLKNKEYTGLSLPGQSSDSMVLSLRIPYKEILNDLKSERKERDSAAYTIFISVGYTTFLGSSEMLVTKSQTLKIPEVSELEILGIKYKKVRLKSIQAVVKMKVINRGSVNLRVTDMRYSLTLPEQGRISGTYTSVIDIRPFGTTVIDLPVEINPDKISRTLFDIMINKDQYEYTLNINALLSSPEQPGQRFHLDLVKTGKMELKK